MRILTVRQPWAWAIIYGGKTVENRTRNLAGSYRGPVAIHVAGKYAEMGVRPPALAEAQDSWCAAAGFECPQHPWQADVGMIIGVVDLVDVHAALDCMTQDHDGDWKVCTEWSERSGYHLVLANPRALDQPAPWKGGLGLRRSPLSVHGDALVEQVDSCTCGMSPISYQHEPRCGFEYVARLVATT